MKNMYLIIILVLIMSFLIIPLLAVEKVENKNTKTESNNRTSYVEESENSADIKLKDLSEIKLYLCEEEKVLTLKKEEYLLGVVAAEMSAENNVEAL